ncbi:serine protease [Carbonactinospora thermoautotrophica]|uniref:S1C family serine protease n=1 Tax=Carbonactinospora thermoautotrophica TaxID=1469144 RepID=UPI00226FD265|nr:trypsin-like peptidase domain-containing protein [Carbonactinospora thermoautotrophica]MCX9192268.1 serine protease [Carbonactinospora thermoautotrophica]
MNTDGGALGPRYPHRDGGWTDAPPAEPLGTLPAPRGRRRIGLVAGAVALSLVSAVTGGGVVLYLSDRSVVTASGVSVEVDPRALSRPADSLAGIAERALPSVVTITVSGVRGGSVGSGFVYDEAGHVLTNAHVVQLAQEGGAVTVSFQDGTRVPARLVGLSTTYDLAVLQVSGVRDLTPLPLGNSDTAKVGDQALAIGSPHALNGTVTAGIISAVNRPWPVGTEGQKYMSALQTDAPINPGNSGGPLINAQGQVIGINTSIETAGRQLDEAGNIGLGFAIPVNQARRVAEELIRAGRANYPILGVVLSADSLTPTGTAVTAGGAVLAQVSEGSAAARAGLRPGDVVTEVDGKKVASGEDLMAALWRKAPGEQVRITYLRDGQTRTVTATLSAEPVG